ncbi:winged helix-turn-helix domain-containing protein [Enterococcus cecorum]|uniref:winged helix-turn-helix domain-containing protein n=1 Tax=Enterococcus cecorum TaxID=44008 RepID=UPI0032C46C8E
MSRSGYYHRVAEDLISRIEDGEFTPGDPLPKQIELAASYQTSRLTIQKAIQILITEGYVYVKKEMVLLLRLKINNLPLCNLILMNALV